MAGYEPRCRAHRDRRKVPGQHPRAVRLADLDPDIMARMTAFQHPHHHRQPGVSREQVRHQKKVFVNFAHAAPVTDGRSLPASSFMSQNTASFYVRTLAEAN